MTRKTPAGRRQRSARNGDESLRRLERAAQLGDPQARTQLVAALGRSGVRHAAESGDRPSALRLATVYARVGILPKASAREFMTYWDHVGVWRGADTQRFSIAHALTVASYWGRRLKWQIEWTREPLRYQGLDGPGEGLIGNAFDRTGEPADGWVNLPTTRPTPGARLTAKAEAFYYGGVIDFAREAGHVVPDPLAWTKDSASGDQQ